MKASKASKVRTKASKGENEPNISEVVAKARRRFWAKACSHAKMLCVSVVPPTCCRFHLLLELQVQYLEADH